MKITSAKNKKILLIMPFFYGYEETILRRLQQEGAQVWLVDNNVYAHSLGEKLIYFYTGRLKDRMLRAYYSKELQNVPADITDVLVIRGSTLTAGIIARMRNRFRKARFTVYQWDSVATYPYQEKIAPLFDRVLSFDPLDAKAYGWEYRPLFYNPEECREDLPMRYDILFLCSMHTHRLQVLLKLRQQAERMGKRFFGYIYVPRLQYIQESVLKRNPLYRGAGEALHFEPLPKEKTIELYNSSLTLADYTFPRQNGLSMRTVESIGHRCKLITNNRNVLGTDFYDPSNIWVYEGEDPEIPAEFLESPYQELPEEVYDRYSLDGFLEDLLSDQRIRATMIV